MGANKQEGRDMFYYYAKIMGFRARSAFKLKDIAYKYSLFDNVKNVVDLCAAPGSWSQFISRETNAKILAIDLQEIDPIENAIILKQDITSDKCISQILETFNGNSVDLVVCDGAPDVTGFHDLDECLQTDLLKSALKICLKVARLNSNFLSKSFKGAYTNYIVNHFKKFYRTVHLLKPESSKSSSAECFILCMGLNNLEFDPDEIEVNENVPDIPIEIINDEISYKIISTQDKGDL